MSLTYSAHLKVSNIFLPCQSQGIKFVRLSRNNFFYRYMRKIEGQIFVKGPNLINLRGH